MVDSNTTLWDQVEKQLAGDLVNAMAEWNGFWGEPGLWGYQEYHPMPGTKIKQVQIYGDKCKRWEPHEDMTPEQVLEESKMLSKMSKKEQKEYHYRKFFERHSQPVAIWCRFLYGKAYPYGKARMDMYTDAEYRRKVQIEQRVYNIFGRLEKKSKVSKMCAIRPTRKIPLDAMGRPLPHRYIVPTLQFGKRPIGKLVKEREKRAASMEAKTSRIEETVLLSADQRRKILDAEVSKTIRRRRRHNYAAGY